LEVLRLVRVSITAPVRPPLDLGPQAADRLVTELASGLRILILDAGFIPVITRYG
jgi:hypothetical protein